jgi:eukaryotic-like serine/threonine-protein kinase
MSDQSRWEKIQSLFHDAAALPEPERLPHLRSVCDGDEKLLAEVLSLLEEDSHGASLLDRDVSDIAKRVFDDPIDSLPFREFGPYRIEKRIGEGGMAVVYLAKRKDLDSLVAVKILRDAWLSPARRERFAAEQRTLAQLNHPSIARLYDANTSPDGTPFFVMEYVEGAPLTRYCHDHNCSTTERLQLFRAVCEAVLYAHQRGVIHRDLKPSNILVREDGAVRLLDFGIAKHIENFGESVEQTATGLRLMTPAYASLEQIRGEPVGIHTDVYSLGVILYELLCGRLPFDLSGCTPAQAEKIIAEKEAEKPSSVIEQMSEPKERPKDIAVARKTFSAELDALCLTAMHKDAALRYHSVDALIRDIDHYLKGEPLEARPATAPYRIRKFFSRNQRSLTWALTMLLIVAMAALAVMFAVRGKIASQNAVARSPIASIAVLPFSNTSGNQGQDYLAGGMTEALVTDLSKVRTLKVSSRTDVVSSLAKTESPSEIGRKLGVAGIVEGSVAGSNNSVRVTVELLRADTGTAIWAETYDRNIQELQNLQRDLARQLIRETQIAVSANEEKQLDDAEAGTPEAHDLYLRGRYFWNQRTRDGLLRSVDYFRQATIADPNYADAYAGLADAYVELVAFGNLVPADGLPKAQAAASKAIALDDSQAEAHAALAYSHAAEWDWVGSQKEFQRALELNPGYVTALYQYAYILSMVGDQKKSIALAQQALQLDPLSPVVMYRAGRVYFHARDYAKAAGEFRRILELNPNDSLGVYGLALVLTAQGKFDDAIHYVQRENFQNSQESFDLAATYAAAGRSAEARRQLTDCVLRLQQQKRYIRPGWVAEVYASLGDKDEAIRWLERGYREHDDFLALLKVWPAFDGLRSDPRFQALVRRMNFPQ